MPLADAQRPDCNCIELGDVVCSSTAHWSSTTKLDWRRMILNVLMSRVVRSCIRICTIGSQLGELGLSLVLRGPVSRIEECLRSLVRVARTCISRYILIPHYGLSSKGGPITLPIASPPPLSAYVRTNSQCLGLSMCETAARCLSFRGVFCHSASVSTGTWFPPTAHSPIFRKGSCCRVRTAQAHRQYRVYRLEP